MHFSSYDLPFRFYVALVMLMFWARAKPVLLLLKVNYREMVFHFQISVLERESWPALNSGDAFSLHTSISIQFACIAHYCLNLNKRFQILPLKAMPRLIKL